MRFYNKAIFFPIAMSLQTDLPPVIKKVIKNSLIIHTKKIYMNFFLQEIIWKMFGIPPLWPLVENMLLVWLGLNAANL